MNIRSTAIFVPRPRLCYVGVIDERIDYELLRALADERPEWSIVMIGPVVKVDPAALPPERIQRGDR